jgi:hypothetical protein
MKDIFHTILGKWSTWRTIPFYVFISILSMFRAKVRKDLDTKRSPTRSDIYQILYWHNWFSWWWARGCSKHVENWNKYIERNCASSWSSTKNHNKMHGQQNIKYFVRYLGAFAKLRKATRISFIISISPRVRLSAWDDSAPTRWIFVKFDIWVFFENMSRKSKFN